MSLLIRHDTAIHFRRMTDGIAVKLPVWPFSELYLNWVYSNFSRELLVLATKVNAPKQ